MKSKDACPARHALVRPVPSSYDRCIRTNCEKIDVALARRQHAEYCRALQELGLSLIWIRGNDTLPDSCFVEDTAVILGEKAVVCNMSVKSRANEVVEVAKVLGELRKMYRIKPPATIDGGDVLAVEDRVFVGISARTNLHAANQLKTILENNGINVIPVEVHKVLHLKSACTYLGNDVVILSRGCFDTNVLQGLTKIIVPRGEEYAADCLSVNETVLIPKSHAQTKRLVEKEGFLVEEMEMSEFRKGDGALTCLSILL